MRDSFLQIAHAIMLTNHDVATGLYSNREEYNKTFIIFKPSHITPSDVLFFLEYEISNFIPFIPRIFHRDLSHSVESTSETSIPCSAACIFIFHECNVRYACLYTCYRYQGFFPYIILFFLITYAPDRGLWFIAIHQAFKYSITLSKFATKRGLRAASGFYMG